MRIRVEIKTAKGCALDVSQKLKPFILGKQRVTNKIWANKQNDRILWVVEGDVRTVVSITKNLTAYDKMITSILNNKLVRKAANLKQEQLQELDTLLHDETRIRLVLAGEVYDLSSFSFQAG